MEQDLDLSFQRPVFDRRFAHLVWACLALFVVFFEVIAHQRPTHVTSVSGHMQKLSVTWADMIQALGCPADASGPACAGAELWLYSKEAAHREARLLEPSLPP